jgi:hypothetical protein
MRLIIRFFGINGLCDFSLIFAWIFLLENRVFAFNETGSRGLGYLVSLIRGVAVLVVLNKLVTTFGKKSNLKFGLIQTPQLH